jgi:hypothetical protein
VDSANVAFGSQMNRDGDSGGKEDRGSLTTSSPNVEGLQHRPSACGATVAQYREHEREDDCGELRFSVVLAHSQETRQPARKKAVCEPAGGAAAAAVRPQHPPKRQFDAANGSRPNRSAGL